MPNWCDNQLIIKGEKAELDKFVQQAKNSPEVQQKRGQEFDILQNLYPCPQELLDTVSGFFGKKPDGTLSDKQIAQEKQEAENRTKYGFKDWYDWCCARWGTKWGDSDTFISEHTEDRVEFSFQSAWSPPIEGLAHISSLFPNLEFILSYEEGGMGYYGVCTFSDGAFGDDCNEISDIEGYNDIDFDDEDSEEDPYERLSELILEAREGLLREVV